MVWVSMAPTTHILCACHVYCAYFSAPCYGWGGHMTRDGVVIVVGAIVMLCMVVYLVLQDGCGVLLVDTIGRIVYG